MKKATTRKQMMVRFDNEELYSRIESLAAQYGLSLNMATQMLLGFAFNEIERQDKKFVPRVVFEIGEDEMVEEKLEISQELYSKLEKLAKER